VLEFPFAEAELAEKGSEDGFRMLAVPAGAEARIISEGWAARLKACPCRNMFFGNSSNPIFLKTIPKRIVLKKLPILFGEITGTKASRAAYQTMRAVAWLPISTWRYLQEAL